MSDPSVRELPEPVAVDGWMRPHGYADAMTGRGRFVVTAGQIGWEPSAAPVFPQGELPPPIARADGTQVPAGTEIPLAEFLKLTKHPILLIWGDYIPKQLDKAYAGTPQEARRIFLEQYKLFAQAANKHGGDVRNVVLPEVGISGNTHYAMSDTNITQVSRFISRWLKEKKLD